MKNIVIINAHPKEGSFCHAITRTYSEAVQAGEGEISVIQMSDYQFEQMDKAFIVHMQKVLGSCEELVIVTPNWWSGVPAKFKYFIDEVFVSGFAFKYENTLPVGLLSIKKATVFITQDSPLFYTFLFMGDPLWKMLKRGVLRFCGIKEVSRITFGNVRNSDPKKRHQWLDKVRLCASKSL